jgi:hypothetical protein
MKNKKLTLPKSLNLKLSKTVLFCLGGGILLLAIAFLGVMRIQQINEQQQLTDELKQVKNHLAALGISTLQTQKEQLQKKIDEANAALNDNTPTLVQYMTSITGDETLFTLAKSCNLIVQDITATETADGKLNDLPCSTFSIEVFVDGTLSNLVNFVTRLKTDFGNSTVESVNIAEATKAITTTPANIPVGSAPTTTTTTGTSTTTTTTIEPPATFEADINLSVYIYKGNDDVK